MTDALDLLALIKADTLELRKAHTAITTEGPDNEVGTNRANTIFGMGGDDIITGRAGADALFGDAGDDSLYGGRGRDKLFGGADDDRLSGGAKADMFNGGEGNDRLYLNGGADRVVYELGDGNEGRDTIYGFTIGRDSITLDGYTNLNVASLLQTSQGTQVTLTETGQQIIFIGIDAVDLQAVSTTVFILI